MSSYIYPLPSGPAKLRATARRYERSLAKELEEHGDYHDGSGKRHLIAPFYLMAGDVPTATERFVWLATTFPNDHFPPECLLCWALALHRAGQEGPAARKLGQAMFANLFLLPRLLGLPREAPPDDIVWVEDTCSHAAALPQEFFDVWTITDRAWAQVLYQSPRFQQTEARCLAIDHELEDLRPGPRRSALCAERAQLEDWT